MAALASVSGTSSVVPSMAIRRKPKRKAPRVWGVAIGKGTLGGQRHRGIEPDEAQATSELAQDASDGDGGVKLEGNDEPDGEGQRQLALALGGDGVVGQGGGDGLLRDGAFERLDGE